MNNPTEYIMPDYFPLFSCKMGACRTACCEGWPISFSLNDYFRLLSVECSPELRRKLDCALHISAHPSPESYGQISPRYDGQCPMRLDDGRCALHAELGDGVLAAVCRLYPRGVRTGETHECSCANSCEAVIELLFDRNEKIRFVSAPMNFDVAEAPARRFHFENAGRELEIRLWLISLIQNRSYSLPQRLVLLGDALAAMNQALKSGDHHRVEMLLSSKEALSVTEPLVADQENLLFSLQIVKRLLEILDKRSDSIRAYGEAVLKFFEQDNAQTGRYSEARLNFESTFPHWEIWFEHMLANHMFFSQFPFQDRPVDLLDEGIALCAVYILLRFLCIGWAEEHEGHEPVVDAAAAAFRLIEHSDFDSYATIILKEIGCDSRTHMIQALCL